MACVPLLRLVDEGEEGDTVGKDVVCQLAAGVVIAQFDRSTIAHAALAAMRGAAERVEVISAMSPDIETLFGALGVDRSTFERLFATIRPDKLLLVARIERGAIGGGVLSALWLCRARI